MGKDLTPLPSGKGWTEPRDRARGACGYWGQTPLLETKKPEIPGHFEEGSQHWVVNPRLWVNYKYEGLELNRREMQVHT